MIQLKNGLTTEDARLNRIPSFDPKSRNFPITATITETKQRSYTWSCRYYLDQGQEGACVGHGVAHEIGARPRPTLVTSETAFDIYRSARLIDEWPGESYSGTSVIAGVKIATERGYFGEYRWAFGLSDLILAIGYKGPAILGIHWLEGMAKPDADGYIHATGSLRGGHCLMAKGVDVTKKRFRLHNSWGTGWGIGGDCYISFDDMDKLLHEEGEACIPVVRKKHV